MCSICGIYRTGDCDAAKCERDVRAMNERLVHRGPDSSGVHTFQHGALAHNRLAVVDVAGGMQPMHAEYGGRHYTVVYNGELYNTEEIRQELALAGVRFQTRSDTEAVLYAYAVWGEDAPAHMNGIFAFAVLCEEEQSLFLARDRFGIKPLFFTERGGEYRFASEVKALLCDRRAVIDREGLWQLFILSPVRAQGGGVFKGIYELLPGECAYLTASGMRRKTYWTLTAHPHTLTRAETIDQTRALVCDAVRRQLVSDVPLATLLSGGLDSSVITALAARQYAAEGRTLSSYSFTYEDSESFRESLFQPESDDLYAAALGAELGCDHTVLRAPIERVASLLGDACLARDFPGQADIDSSLLYFCGEVKRRHTVVLSGECSDEIFGGYPWFYRPEMLMREHFPWLHDPHVRIALLRGELAHEREGMLYMKGLYRACIDGVDTLEEDTSAMRLSRRATALSVRYFMTNLLERKDRMSMAHALEVRVPFADHRILEFVYNVPWEIKFENRVEKALLRNAMREFLPGRVLWRKKSPYPKTHSKQYERTVRSMLAARMEDESSVLHRLLNRSALTAFCERESATWQGQLMATPQMLAWLIQLDVFCRAYDVSFEDE